jgi:CRP-like cAMP-binding protein
MLNDVTQPSPHAGPQSAILQQVLRKMPEGCPEQQAVDAGEVDAVIDYATGNVIMLPTARRALHAPAIRAPGATGQASAVGPVANGVLAALPRTDYERLLSELETVNLRLGEVLHEPGAPIRYVYFPIDCVVCLLTRTEEQRAVGTAMVGYEGMVGVSSVLGVDVSPVRALVQVGGTALRMPTERLHAELLRCLPLQRALYRHAYMELVQARQTVACIDSHCLEQRLACWLLMTSDRSRSPEIVQTQEDLAASLNVRRESVTGASLSLRARKLIDYRRGKIRIANRKGLEGASCSCYTKIETLHMA